MNLKNKDYTFVGIQFALFFIYVFNIKLWNIHFPKEITTTGLICSLLGAVILVLALLQLNKNLSPFPTPKSNAELIKNGLYKYIRHPIYTGILIMLFGNAIRQESLFKLLITFILLMLFLYKTSYEEKRLENKYADYKAYKKNTGRFFPKL